MAAVGPSVDGVIARDVVLTDDFGADGVGDVRCPGSIEIVTGASFRCDATIDGDPVTVPVRITNDDGGYEVGRPV